MDLGHQHEAVANRILRALPEETLHRLWPALDRVETVNGQVVGHVDELVEYVYFINRGLASVIKTLQDGRTVEIGAVGVEGVTDCVNLFGIGTAFVESVIQVPGTAFRIRREVLQQEIDADAALREMMHLYVRFAFAEIAQTAACNRLHSIEKRCSRWLLVAHDNALSDTFPLTHEFLAMMLGTQRAGVTIAASALRRAGLIAYRRGRITVTDRLGLETASCECYATMQAELLKLFGKEPSRHPRH